MLVTPEMAKQWLQLNDHNRRLDKGRLARYVADMRAGRWQLTHQAIGISAEGILVDGQHRLSAVVESGCEVPFLVCLDADPDTFGVVDQGKVRTANDVWKIGRKSSSGVAAIAKLVYMYENHRNNQDWGNLSKMTAPETVYQWASQPVAHHSGHILYADVFAEAVKHEARWRKEVQNVGSSVGAALAIMLIHFGVRIDVVWEAACQPIVTSSTSSQALPVLLSQNAREAP